MWRPYAALVLCNIALAMINAARLFNLGTGVILRSALSLNDRAKKLIEKGGA